MCNLYRMSKAQDEVAHFFDAIAQDLSVSPGSNAPEMVYPGYPGLVVTADWLASMTWGFPLARTGAKGQPLKPKPINNARTDKLSSPFWSASFRARRCLIPVSAFAEAEGPKGGKTRTWFSLPESDLMAVAGFWRDSAEFGEAYTMVMTEACIHVEGVHDRMPVILPPAAWSAWLGGAPEEAFALCRPYAGDMQVERTDEPWAGWR
ncbi:SOS response-associated peptidase [Aurantiacibacter poecillastricola]|uniref:SOS response-associated peptidase n=1 Tax=Aurantiacibacter poecillastricola TaxID=3064385 RepID=UPI00273E7118|nr:SOS response-associated peptidase family protein [Aurantiacibacter sp. 219JJ12-13]MDP5262961.1 SOS response-associated peptidase family protein [Aurantiacibacter sp. 219JJ12-13]